MASPGRIVNICSMAGKQKQIRDKQLLQRFQVTPMSPSLAKSCLLKTRHGSTGDSMMRQHPCGISLHTLSSPHVHDVQIPQLRELLPKCRGLSFIDYHSSTICSSIHEDVIKNLLVDASFEPVLSRSQHSSQCTGRCSASHSSISVLALSVSLTYLSLYTDISHWQT